MEEFRANRRSWSIHEKHLTSPPEESAESIKELTPDEQETTLASRNCKMCKNCQRNSQKSWLNRNRHLLAVKEEILQIHLVPKDPDCETCMRTKVTSSLQTTFTKSHTRATKFGQIIITADHKVINEEVESRNNQRCASVVHGLATKWVESYP